MSLIPEKPLVISPNLAQAIGLEEAVLLQLLQECLQHSETTLSSGFCWANIAGEKILKLAPFWQEADVRRLTTSLHEKGILLIGGAGFTGNNSFRFAFNEPNSQGVQQNTSNTVNKSKAPHNQATPHSAKTIGNSWQPSKEALRQLSQLGVTENFALEQIPAFIAYWRDRNVSRHSWEGKFIDEVWRRWQRSATNQHLRMREVTISADWRPSADALDILIQQGGVNANFIDDAIPEFILYWRDRGITSSTWDSKFIQHVRRQWQYFNGLLEQDSMPRPIRQDWQPKEMVFDVLQMANIQRSFAEQSIPEFILYWQENGTPQSSWSTKFLQYVKRRWAYQNSNSLTDQQNAAQQTHNRKSRIRDRSFIEDLTDRSWAS